VANDRNGGRLRLIASRHDDDDELYVNFDLLVPKSEAFISLPKCIVDISLVKIWGPIFKRS